MKKGECLKFGQIVSISPLEFQRHFIFSDGFIKDTASLTEIQEDDLGSGTRFAQSLYKLYPSFVTSRLQQAIELKEELKKDKYLDESKRVSKILESQQKVIVEYKMNIETSSKQNNLPLSFNSAIQFLHIATNKFLTCNYKEAEFQRDNFRLELNEFPSQKSCFRLLPAFQHQFGQEAQIYAEDSVYIELDQLYIGNSSRMHVANSEVSVNLEKYLGNRQLFVMPNLKLLDRVKSDNILLGGQSKSNPKTLEGSRLTSRQHSQIGNTKVQTGNKSSQSKEVNISLEKSSAWIISIYDNENDDENVICYGDIIWIHHVEENSIICMLRNEKDELLISYQDLGKEIQEFQGNSNGMFQVEAKDLRKGGRLQWGEAIRLRHFSLGKYLAIYGEKTINSSGSYLLYLSDTPTTSSLFQLVQLPSSDLALSSKYVTKDAFFKLKTFGLAKDQWVHLERQKQYLNLNVNDQVLVEEDIPIISCRLTNQSEDEDVLKLYKANYGEVMETNFLLSCFPVLRESLEFIKDFKGYDSKNRENFNDTVNLLSKVLEELDRFCNNEMINTQLDLKSDKRANINRQRKLREQFFIEIMIEILIKMTTEEELEKYDEHQRTLRALHILKIEKKLAREKLNKNQPNHIQHQHHHPKSQSRSGQNSNAQSEVPSPSQSQIYQYTTNDPMNSPDVQLFTKLIATPTIMHQKPIMKYQQPHNQDEDIISDGDGGLIYKSVLFNSQVNSPLGLDKYQDQNSSLHSQSIINKFKVSVKKAMAINTINKTKDNQHFIVLNKKIKVLKLIYKLLTSICQENEENQYYVYCKFSEFLYQSKYFKEATDCIIKILGGNEQILTNLCDNIRLNETKRIVHKNYIDQDLSEDSEMHNFKPESELEFNILDMKDVNDNVLLYYKYMTENSPIDQKNIQFIQFFRAICRFQNKGITVNQEMIFKFIKQDNRFKNSLFMPLVIESSQIKIQYGEKNIIFLTSVNDPEIYNYLISQLYLYAELALERNFLWKCYLERIFPIEFVFNQIFDKQMNIDYRSAFCNIALSIYVDHEPFNKSIVPNLCRIVVQDDIKIFNLKMPKINAQRREKQKIMVEHLEFLVDNTFHLINKTCLLIDEELEKQINIKSADQVLIDIKIGLTKIDNFITNQLIYDITKLIDMIVTFDIISLMKNNDKQQDLFLNMVKMLEFDRNNMLFSYILYVLRKNKLVQAIEKENKNIKFGIRSKISSIIGQTIQDLVALGVKLQTSILGVSKKQQDSLEVVFSEYDTTKISRNPIIGSLVTITTQIGALNSPQVKQTNILFCDLEIKIKICEIINFFQDQRQNYFIENFLSYYKSISDKFKLSDKLYLHYLQKEVKQELVKVLPNLLRTGILSIDEKATKASEDTWQPDNEDLLAVGVRGLMSKKNSFTHYLKTDVVLDLDKLMSGSNSDILESEILPSLLVSFYIASDLELQDKLIQLMRRCYSQKKELFNYLSRIEILFDRNDIQCYYYLQTTVQNLKSLSQCSEVWLVDFLAESQGPDKEIKILIKMVQDIRYLLFMDTKIDEKGSIIPGKPIVSFNRQKIFFYLDIHLPILNYIRDTQNQFAKVLRDPFFSQETKNTSILALSSMYKLLSDFCQANEANQAELFPEIQLYLDEIGLDLGQIDLICSIYKDNKLRCEQIPDQLLSQFLRFIKIHGRQERFLRLFIIIQDYQGNYLLENQIRVRKLFIPKTLGTEKFTDIYEYQFYGEFVYDQLKFDFSIIEESKQIDEPYIYHSKILEMLLKTVKGESGFKLNVPHLKRIFNLNYFLTLLMKEDGMFQKESIIPKEYLPSDYQSLVGITGMKPYIAQLVTQIYINNTVVDQFLFIKEQRTFYLLFDKERLRFEKLEQSEKYTQYFFDEIIVMMQYYNTKLILKDGNGEFSERDDYKQLELIVTNILQMSNNVLNNKLNPMQYNNLIKFVFSVDESILKQNVGIFSQCLEQTNIQTPAKINSDDQDQDYDLKTVKANIFSKEQQILPDSKLLNKDKNDVELLRITPQEPRISQITQNQKKQNKIQSGSQKPEWFSHENFNLFRQICMDSKQYQRELQIELSILGQCFIDINQFIPQTLVKELPIKISFDEVLKKLIRFVEMGVINKSEKQNLIFTLEILENILENAPDLEQMQNKFDSCQSTKMFLNLLADFNIYPFDDDLMLQLLKFICIATKGGNIRIQSTIYNYLANYEKSEMIMFKIHSIIYDVIQDQQEIQRQKQQDKIIVELASFQNQFFSQGETQQSQEQKLDTTQNDIQSFRKMQQKILIQLLQFLQLICEGHNLSIQNYLRYQTNSRNNYNIVQAMVDLLQVYQIDLQKEGFEVIVNTLDALTEFIQGPCNKNQQDIIDGQFLDFASQILIMQKKKTKQQNIQTPDIQSTNREFTTPLKSHIHMTKQVDETSIERWMLERLKYKCMVLVTSLLELNTDEMAIKRIMRSLPIVVLKQNLTSVYKKYTKMYGKEYTGEVLNHIYADPNDDTQILKSGYHEMIIETGFFIYFLICYYANLSQADIDLETSKELTNIKNDENSKDNDALGEFKNNIIGQLLSLAYALVTGILESVNSVRASFQKKYFTKKQKNISPETKANRKLLQEQELLKQSIQFFAKNSASIEVLRNGKLEKIVFFKISYCNYLPKENKTEFHENVDRDSINAKINDLVTQAPSIIEICKHEEELAIFFSKNKFIAIFANYVILWKDLAFMLTIALNIFIIISYYAGQDGNNDENYYERLWEPRFLKTVLTKVQTKQLFSYCGYMMIICSTFVVSFFLMKKGPLYVRAAWSENSNLIKEGQVWIVRWFLKLFLVINCLIRVLMNMEVLYYLTYGTLAFIATLFHPFFFAFHLSEVVIRYPVLRNIIKSIWDPKKSLFLTLVLIFILNYYFSLISYVSLSNKYDNNKCETLIICFMATFDYAFKNNGGIGGWFNGITPQTADNNYSYYQFFYDNMNNIIIQLIMIHIFSGIIIDTFGSLREKQQAKDDDLCEVCFVCGQQRELFDRKQDYGFPQHTKKEHYMWNYVFYIAYLYDKKKNERNGIETYISEKMKLQDNSWFPIGQALGLQSEIINSQLLQQEQIKGLEHGMQSIRKNMDQIQDYIGEINQYQSIKQ